MADRSDERAATQLPLFHGLYLIDCLPTEPERTVPLGTVDALKGAHLNLVTPCTHRESLAKRDRDRADALLSLSSTTVHDIDKVTLAYAYFSHGDARLAVFEQFVTIFRNVFNLGILDAWLRKLEQEDSDNRKHRAGGRRR